MHLVLAGLVPVPAKGWNSFYFQGTATAVSRTIGPAGDLVPGPHAFGATLAAAHRRAYIEQN